MKLLEHPAVTAFGATTIFLLILLAPLASSFHSEIYHLYGPLSAVLLPVLLNVTGVWLVLTLLLGWGRRHAWVNACVWSALGAALPWMFLMDWFKLSTHVRPPRPFAFVFLGFLLLVIASTIGWPSRSLPRLRTARKFATIVLGFVAVSGVVLLAQIAWSAWQARRLDTWRALHQPAALAAHRSRIVWLVLDELSYRQVYEHRFPRLALPAFDRLAAEASVFTHVLPAGYYTEVVLPSLITGQRLDGVGTPAAGLPLLVKNSRGWRPFNLRDTVFEDALDAGYGTAIAGWVNPYCRILPDVLDHCYWTSHTGLRGGIIPGRSVGWNAAQPVLRHLLSIVPWLPARLRSDAESGDVVAHRLDYRELQAAGDKLLNDSSVTFLLLHMPIPHPPGVYDRRASMFADASTSYLDNLALCDLYLAHLRQELESSGTWDSTTLVIMGDHSWRVHDWSQLPGWTAEEQAASDGGRFDDRPAYIVKLADQHTAARIDTPFAALRTRALFDALFAGRIRTPEQLADWTREPDFATTEGRR